MWIVGLRVYLDVLTRNWTWFDRRSFSPLHLKHSLLKQRCHFSRIYILFHLNSLSKVLCIRVCKLWHIHFLVIHGRVVIWPFSGYRISDSTHLPLSVRVHLICTLDFYSWALWCTEYLVRLNGVWLVPKVRWIRSATFLVSEAAFLGSWTFILLRNFFHLLKVVFKFICLLMQGLNTSLTVMNPLTWEENPFVDVFNEFVFIKIDSWP